MMKTHALVVESRKEIIEELEDRLISINHTCEIATCQVQARQCLHQHNCEYSYIILSLDIPARPDRPPKIKFGFNLFKEVQKTYSGSPLPIVLTLNYRNINSEAVVAMVNDGAYVAVKPFEDYIELSLEEAIFKALKSKACPAEKPKSKSPAVIDQFNRDVAVENSESNFIEPESDEQVKITKKPEMTFYNNRVELCGVAVCGDSSQLTRRLLDLLKERSSEGKYRAFSGYELAVITDCESGQQGISACISKFRTKAYSLIDDQYLSSIGEIIINDRLHGYRLDDNIEVIDDIDTRQKTVDVESKLPSGLSENQQEILNFLLKNKKAGRSELEEQLSLPGYSINRQLQSLREIGLVRCVGKGKSTLWLPVEE